MNSESSTNVLTRQWRIVTGSETASPRNRMPERGASGSVGAPLNNLRALPGNSNPLHVLQENLLTAAVIEFRCPAVGVAGDSLSGFRRRQCTRPISARAGGALASHAPCRLFRGEETIFCHFANYLASFFPRYLV